MIKQSDMPQPSWYQSASDALYLSRRLTSSIPGCGTNSAVRSSSQQSLQQQLVDVATESLTTIDHDHWDAIAVANREIWIAVDIDCLERDAMACQHLGGPVTQ